MSDVTESELKRAEVELEEAQRLRGWIANSYAQIEFALGDLILRCREFPEYYGHTNNLPHGAPDRVKRVRRIISTTGPLQPFAKQLEKLLCEFEDRHETRNLLAHGFATYMFTPNGDTGLYFQKWHRQPDRIDARLTRTFRMADLQREMEEFVGVTQRGMTLLLEIQSRFNWVEGPYK